MMGSVAPSRPERQAPATAENGLYFDYALRMKGLFSKEVRRALRAAGLRSQRNSCS
jgi:hypothetical protein